MPASNRKRTTPYSSRSLANDDLIAPRWHPKRSSCVMAVITLAFAALVARAGWVQIVEHEFHVAQGEKRHRQMLELAAKRGPIVDRHGALLAVSLTTYEIWAEPKRVDSGAIAPLAQALALSPAALLERLDSGRINVLLKRHVDAQTASYIASLGIAGVTRIPSSKRFYPEGEAAAHVVGLTDINDLGQEGVELAANA